MATEEEESPKQKRFEVSPEEREEASAELAEDMSVWDKLILDLTQNRGGAAHDQTESSSDFFVRLHNAIKDIAAVQSLLDRRRLGRGPRGTPGSSGQKQYNLNESKEHWEGLFRKFADDEKEGNKAACKTISEHMVAEAPKILANVMELKKWYHTQTSAYHFSQSDALDALDEDVQIEADAPRAPARVPDTDDEKDPRSLSRSASRPPVESPGPSRSPARQSGTYEYRKTIPEAEWKAIGRDLDDLGARMDHILSEFGAEGGFTAADGTEVEMGFSPTPNWKHIRDIDIDRTVSVRNTEKWMEAKLKQKSQEKAIAKYNEMYERWKELDLRFEAVIVFLTSSGNALEMNNVILEGIKTKG